MTVEEFKKLKPGDKVLIKNRRSNIWDGNGGMDKYMGQVVTIANVIVGGGCYFSVYDQDSGEYWLFTINDIESVVIEELVIENKAVRKPDGQTSGAGTYADLLNKEMDSLYESLRKQAVESYVNDKKIEIYEQFFNDLAALAKEATDKLNKLKFTGGDGDDTEGCRRGL